MQLKAEVIAIGDELVSGQRLDTNTQWISQQLCDLGILVAFHSTIGDNHVDNVNAFKIAAGRADFVVATGGLGPTADDLTRQAIADAAEVELEFHPEIVEHIRKIFARYSREMPASNQVQAWFPKGSRVVENPEGTAPGIDFDFPGAGCRIFALPGVPAEMKQMWETTVAPAIQNLTGDDHVIHHHVLHCFGVGESQAESMLPDMISRDRFPRVGITASFATISLRVTARDQSVEKCMQQMQPTIDQIRKVMGTLVFGENGQQLQDVVHQQLVKLQQTISIVDCGLKGDVAKTLMSVDGEFSHSLNGGLVLDESAAVKWLKNDVFDLALAAKNIAAEFSSDIGIAIGAIMPPTKTVPRGIFSVAIHGPFGVQVKELSHGGHSAIRQARSVKQVLNELRLILQNVERDT